MIDLDKPLDQLDYKIVPLTIVENEHAWQVQVLTGEYKDINLVFTHIEINGKQGNLKFSLDAVDNENQWVEVTPDLQDFAFDILQDIVKKGLLDGSVVIYDKDSDN